MKLDREGRVLLTADAPNARELPPPAVEPEEQAESPEAAAAAKKAREDKIAELQKQVNELSKEYYRATSGSPQGFETGRSGIGEGLSGEVAGAQDSEAAAEVRGGMQELSAARQTPEMRAYQARAGCGCKR